MDVKSSVVASRGFARFATPLHGATLVAFMAASAAPTPLYQMYLDTWAFSPFVLTAIFAVYALGLLGALMIFGSLSDYIGRRPVIFAALLVQILSMVLFITAQGADVLIAARFVQGLATGAGMGALGAAMIDSNRITGPTINSIAPLLGMAAGALGASVLVGFAPHPLRLVYISMLAVFVVQAALLWTLPETAPRRPGALASLRPQVFVPPRARRALLLVSPVNVAVWALGGFYLSLVPSIARAATGLTSPLVGGVLVAALTLSGTAAVLVLRQRAASLIFMLGTSALAIGLVAILVAVHLGSPWLIAAATIVVGLGHGSGYLGGLRTVMPLAEPEERAGLLSAIYVESYVAFSVPAVLAGLLAREVGLLRATDIFGAVLIVLALGALVAARRWLSAVA